MRVLTYHRIDDINEDPTHLAVKINTFRKHIEFLEKHFQFISTNELIEKIKNKQITGNEIVITFDDGYKDNIEALKELSAKNIPSTLFITTSQLGKKSDHPWDKLYIENEIPFFLNENEIINLRKDFKIEIGGHTENHLSLKKLDPAEQLKEITLNKDKLQSMIGEKIIFFSYPFGNFNNIDKNSIRIVRGLYEAAFMNNNKLVTDDCDIYKIPRINIRNWNLVDFKKAIYYE